jgi:hypothetical protein
MKSFQVGTIHSADDYATKGYDEWAVLAIVIVLGLLTIGFIASRLSM